MRTFFSILILGSFFSENVNAQVLLTFGSSYANQNMKDLKGLNQEFKAIYGVTGSEVTSFPAYFGLEATFSYQFKANHIGLLWALNSTGSRVAYSDYSGNYKFDQLLTSNQLGLHYGWIINNGGSWDMTPSIRLGLNNSSLTIKSHLQLGGSIASENIAFVSKSLFLCPGFGVRKNFPVGIFLSLDIRYLIDVPENLVWVEDHEVYLLNNKNTPLAAQWSGIRLIGSFGIKFGSKK